MIFGLFMLPEHNATNHLAATNIVSIIMSVCVDCITYNILYTVVCLSRTFTNYEDEIF